MEKFASACTKCTGLRRAPRGKKITYRKAKGAWMYVHKDAPEEEPPTEEGEEEEEAEQQEDSHSLESGSAVHSFASSTRAAETQDVDLNTSILGLGAKKDDATIPSSCESLAQNGSYLEPRKAGDASSVDRSQPGPGSPVRTEDSSHTVTSPESSGQTQPRMQSETQNAEANPIVPGTSSIANGGIAANSRSTLPTNETGGKLTPKSAATNPGSGECATILNQDTDVKPVIKREHEDKKTPFIVQSDTKRARELKVKLEKIAFRRRKLQLEKEQLDLDESEVSIQREIDQLMRDGAIAVEPIEIED